MKINVNYEKLSYQEKFHYSEKAKVFLSAGYGAGKTYSLVMKALRLAQLNKGMRGGVLAPNLKMFKRDVWPTFQEVCDENKIKIKFNRQESALYIPVTDSEIFVFHDEDHGESIRGPNLAWGVINEVTLISEAGFKAFLARIRVKEAKLLQLAMSGTPEGFTWHYDYFISDPRSDTELIFGDMRLNKYVSDSYAKTLVDSYDDVMAQQFVEGKYVNLNSKAAVYKFNRHKHTRTGIVFDPNAETWVHVDFNVAPMAATFYNRYKDSLEGFDEIKIPDNADTFQLADAIKAKVGTKGVVLFPDPAGKQRKTSSRDLKTDIQILEEAGFTDMRYKSSIRSVKDQFLAVNAFVGKNKIVWDSEKCKETIKDLEQCVFKEGTNELDKKDSKRTHWLDGLKNMIHYEFPIVEGAGGWRNTQIR